MQQNHVRLQPESSPDPRWRQKLAEAKAAHGQSIGTETGLIRVRPSRARRERDLLINW